MTIRRDGKDEFHLTTCNLSLSKDQLLERLRKSGVWSEEQLDRLMEMEVGDETPAPTSYYIIKGVKHASVGGVIGKPL